MLLFVLLVALALALALAFLALLTGLGLGIPLALAAVGVGCTGKGHQGQHRNELLHISLTVCLGLTVSRCVLVYASNDACQRLERTQFPPVTQKCKLKSLRGFHTAQAQQPQTTCSTTITTTLISTKRRAVGSKLAKKCF